MEKEDAEMCECCGLRPKEEGHRKLCHLCWKQNGEVPDAHRKNTSGNAKSGRS